MDMMNTNFIVKPFTKTHIPDFLKQKSFKNHVLTQLDAAQFLGHILLMII
jgi:hypothetical protein